MDLCRGTPPNDFLKKIGVGFGMQDMAAEAGKEAKQAADEKKQLADARFKSSFGSEGPSIFGPS